MPISQQRVGQDLSVAWGEFAPHRLPNSPSSAPNGSQPGPPTSQPWTLWALHTSTPSPRSSETDDCSCSWSRPRPRATTSFAVARTRYTATCPTRTAREATSSSEAAVNRPTMPQLRAAAVKAASYTPNDRYVLFELRIAEARCNGYGNVRAPRATVVAGHRHLAVISCSRWCCRSSGRRFNGRP